MVRHHHSKDIPASGVDLRTLAELGRVPRDPEMTTTMEAPVETLADSKSTTKNVLPSINDLESPTMI
jgi:hypothetical protein